MENMTTKTEEVSWKSQAPFSCSWHLLVTDEHKWHENG